MLLRDMTVAGKRKELLKNTNFFIPILNVDGHERRSAFNRVDEAFSASQRQRLMWFYEQTPFYDEAYLLYPVARIPQTD